MLKAKHKTKGKALCFVGIPVPLVCANGLQQTLKDPPVSREYAPSRAQYDKYLGFIQVPALEREKEGEPFLEATHPSGAASDVARSK